MAEVYAPHPTAQHLADFAQGRLTPARAETVARHLETCPDCARAVGQIAGDSFCDLVRSARPSGTYIPGGKLLDVPPMRPGLDVPPELVNHPKFHLEKELGRGGMGVVYKAKNLKLGNTVALKVITRGLSTNPEALKRFQQEVHAAGKLDHPNIVKALDADQAGDVHLLVMDFVDGLDLAEVLKKKGPLPIPNACEYIRQAALGLQHAHEQGMIHRDIKPKNLMLTRKGQVKILDFGLAAITGDKTDRTKLTQQGILMGMIEYIAPEQAEDATRADIRSDIYSLGCSLYSLLTGSPPFVRDTDVKIILAHLGEVARPLHEVRADMPPRLSAVVAKMLAKDPGQRYQTPQEVVQALREFCKPGGKPAPLRASDKGTVLAPSPMPETAVEPVAPKAPQQKAAPPQASPFQDLDFDKAQSAPAKAPRNSAASGRVRWMIGSAVGVGVLLLAGVVGLLASGMFQGKPTTTGPSVEATKPHPDVSAVLIVETNELHPDVYVDGEKVTAVWDSGGRRAEIPVRPGMRRVEVKKDGFTGYGEEIEIKDGKRHLLEAKLARGRKESEPTSPRPPRIDYTAKTVGMHFVEVPKGTFWVSEYLKNAVKQRTIESNFFMGVYEVTQEQWQKVTGKKAECEFSGTFLPVENVSWDKVQNEFLLRLNEQDRVNGWVYRLPTENEWEYACRDGATTFAECSFDFYLDRPKNDLSFNEANFDARYPAGNGVKGDYLGRTTQVGSYQPNKLGLYDMHGNVWEWCEERYSGSLNRRTRGGSWYNIAFNCKASKHDSLDSWNHKDNIGFRVVRVPVGPK